MRLLLSWLLLAACPAVAARADEPLVVRPEVVPLTAVKRPDGWVRWDGIANLEGLVANRERATSLHIAPDGDVWVGTSRGRLLRHAEGAWTLEARLDDLQITGIAAAEGDVVWVSTSDGMCRLRRPDEASPDERRGWVVERFRQYYEGHPSFVSGGYIPGEDSRRLWGFVDDVFVPEREKTYAPYVVSVEHGLFTWGAYHGAWHHFLPHFWGANSAWLDTRQLVPHRRPTCLAESREGDLWIGADGDGIVRISAHARRYHQRDSDDNEPDGTEFSRFSESDVGAEFARANDISPGPDGGAWAALEGSGEKHYVARFHDDTWSTVELPTIKRHTYRQQQVVKTKSWQPRPLCVAEISPGRVLVGVEDAVRPTGLFELDWERREFQKVADVEHPVREIERAADGAIWVQTWWAVYCLDGG